MGSFIRESNPNALDSTKKNIQNFGQKQPGVVLEDGRVIDGNRRFTCLRELQSEGTLQYFESIILSDKDGLNERDIKRLELNLQHAEERPVDYNPIDDLVDVYRDIVQDKLFTVEQYAHETNKKVNAIKKSVAAANLMVKFLEFINQDGDYFIARDMSLDGPLREIELILNRIDEEIREETMQNCFAALLTVSGDMTRRIREIGKNILGTDQNEEFSTSYDHVVEHIYTTTKNNGKVDNVTELFSVINEKPEILEDGRKIIESYIGREKRKNAKNEPLELLEKGHEYISSVDLFAAGKLDQNSKTIFLELVEEIRELTNTLEESLNVK